MQLRSITDIGIKRKDNQDNYWSCHATIDNTEAGIMCVCDGMGGLNNGRLASSIVVNSIIDGFKAGIPFKELEYTIKEANSKVYSLGGTNNARMGTTCTLIECIGGRYKILHIGDSRCYLIRNHELIQLTTDHSAVAQYGLSPETDYELWKKYKNSLTRCIGVKPTIDIDYYEGFYKNGDKFLVCSDGMWHYFETEGFRVSDLNDLHSLVSKCIENGETDNITCSVIEI